jgi:hypothetical protein
MGILHRKQAYAPTRLDVAAYHLCRFANGREACVCDKRNIKPCRATEVIVNGLADEIRLFDKEQAKLARQAKKAGVLP